MNCLEYNFSSDQDEGTRNWQSLKVDVCFNRDPNYDGDSKVNLDIWVSYRSGEEGTIEGKPELDSFDERTAIALRDFLIFCFPLNGKH